MILGRALGLGATGLALTACGGGDEPRLSALLVTLDTTRADSLSCYGAPPGVTPHLDALAAEGVLYREARTVTPVTLPSHVSMLTGLYPPRHTVRANGQMKLPETARTLAEDAQAAGYQTAAVIGAVVLRDEFGTAQGFEHFDQPEVPAYVTELHGDYRSGEAVADAAISWLRARDPERPFLLWVHFYDPHLPYEAPARFVQQAGGAPYLGEVAAMDHAIGRVLDALREEGLWDETIVLAVADHGEALGDHGEMTHGCLVYDAVLRVPLIVRHPDGRRAGESSSEITSVADVYPTLAEGLGLGFNADIDGRSLYEREVPAGRGVYFESYYGFLSFGWSQLAGWADEDGKYIHSSAPEFYDVGADPTERNDLAASAGDGLERYRAEIEALARRPALVAEATDRGAAAILEQMRRLGYVGAGTDAGAAGVVHPLAPTGRPSPRTRIEAHRTYLKSVELQVLGRAGEAVGMLEALLAENPFHHLAWNQLSTAYRAEERLEDAIRAAEKSLAIGTEWYGPHYNLGICHDMLGDPAQALEHYERVVAYQPRHEEVIDRAIFLCAQLGRAEELAVWKERKRAARAGG